jgi:hypothetical protein
VREFREREEGLLDFPHERVLWLRNCGLSPQATAQEKVMGVGSIDQLRPNDYKGEQKLKF